MTTLYAYQKATDDYTTYSATLPEGATELATIDGTTYFAAPDAAVLPQPQPQQIQIEAPAITLQLLQRLDRASPAAAAARRQAEDDVASGAKTRAQANNALRVRMRELGLTLTRKVAVNTLRQEAERRKVRGGFAAPALANGTVRWLPIDAYTVAALAAAKQATAVQVSGAKLIALDGNAYPLTAARVTGCLDAMWVMLALIDDAADAAIASLPATVAELEAFDFGGVAWPAQSQG
jgi:hypothetical protein